MIEIFKNKSIWKKIVIVLVTIIMVEFMFVYPVRAGDEDDDDPTGALLNPILQMLVSFGDTIISGAQQSILGLDTTFIVIDRNKGWLDWLNNPQSVINGAALLIFTLANPGAGLIVTGALLAGDLFLESQSSNPFIPNDILTYHVEDEEGIPDTVYLPIIVLSPQEIFANRIPLFDVNFFDTQAYINDKEIKQVEQIGVKDLKYKTYVVDKNNSLTGEYKWLSYNSLLSDGWSEDNINKGYSWRDGGLYYYILQCQYTTPDGQTFKSRDLGESMGALSQWLTDLFTGSGYIDSQEAQGVVDQVNSHTKGMLYYNEPTSNVVITGKTKEEVKQKINSVTTSLAQTLQSNISKGYNALRSIAIVGLLSILVYVGIRIILSSVASEKSKYQQMLIDWLVALCLLFVLHYIMAFSVNIVENITKFFSQSFEPVAKFEIQDDQIVSEFSNIKSGDSVMESYVQGNTLNWIANNFMGQARMLFQGFGGNGDVWTKNSYGIIYFILVVYTIYFVFIYLKRFVYMAFLTLIAPMVALTYPIDKMTDGKAQAFNAWLKEYIFNLMIQPMHLILYTVLIGTAMDLATQNLIYVIVALGFMLPGEKLLRSFFGFSKAQTPPGLLGGPVATGLVMGAINKVRNFGAGGAKGDGANPNNNTTQTNPNLTYGFNATNALLNGSGAGTGSAGSTSGATGGTGGNGGNGGAGSAGGFGGANGYSWQTVPNNANLNSPVQPGYTVNGNGQVVPINMNSASATGGLVAGNGPIHVTGNVITGGGNVQVTGGSVTGSGPIQSTGGSVTGSGPIQSTGSVLTGGGVISAAGNVVAGSGSIQAAGDIVTGNDSSGSGNTNVITAGTGGASISGNGTAQRLTAPKGTAQNKASKPLKSRIRDVSGVIGRKTIRGVGGLAKKGVSLGLGSTLGAAAGLTSLALTGDPGKSMGALGAGFTAGASFASGGIRKTRETASSAANWTKNTVSEVKRAGLGDAEFLAKEQEKAGKKARKNKDIRNALEVEYDEQTAAEMLKEGGAVEQLGSRGYGDAQNVLAYRKMVEEGEIQGDSDGVQKYIALAKTIDTYGDVSLSSEKADDVQELLKRNFMEHAGQSEDVANQTAKNSIALMKQRQKQMKKYSGYADIK